MKSKDLIITVAAAIGAYAAWLTIREKTRAAVDQVPAPVAGAFGLGSGASLGTAVFDAGREPGVEQRPNAFGRFFDSFTTGGSLGTSIFDALNPPDPIAPARATFDFDPDIGGT